MPQTAIAAPGHGRAVSVTFPFLTNSEGHRDIPAWPPHGLHGLIRTGLRSFGGIHESRPTLTLIMYLRGHSPVLKSPIRYL